MHATGTLLEDLAVVLCVAAVTTILFRRLGQPAVLGYLLAGLVVGPSIPIPLFADHDRMHVLSELGVILVMFSIGLHFSVAKLVKVIPLTGVIAVVQISAMISLGYVAGQALGWTSIESIFAGSMICISSTMLLARVFAEQNVKGDLFDLVFGVLVLQDVAAILLIAFLTTVASGGDVGGEQVALTAGRLAGFLVGTVVIGFLVVPRLIRAVAKLGSSETLLVTSIGLCFALSLLAAEVGYSVALGAFLAGSLIAESDLGHEIDELIRPVRDMFAAIFFVAIGMLVDPQAIVDHWGAVLVFTGVVLVGQSAAVAIGALLAGQDVRLSIQAGLSLAQIGEFGFIIAGIGVAGGVTGSFLLPVAVAVAVLTTFLTPLAVRHSRRLALSLDRRLPRGMQTFISLYASWLDALRSGWRRPGVLAPFRRLLWLLLLDAAMIAAIIIVTSTQRHHLTAWLLERVEVSAEVIEWSVLGLAALACVPFLIGLFRCVRALGIRLAAAALPEATDGKLDLAAAPRRVLIVTLQLVLAVLVGAPLVALTQPFIPAPYGIVLLIAAVAALAVTLWRSASDLAEHVKAGAHVVLEVIKRQASDRSVEQPVLGLTARKRAELDLAELDLAPAQQVLPGLGPITAVRLAPGSPVVGVKLAELELHGRTGAFVIAVAAHDEDREAAPAVAVHRILQVGDVIALAGSHAAIEAAERLLANGPARPSAGPNPDIDPKPTS